MGIIIAKFRKKKTTLEILEKLENEIRSIEEFRRNTEQAQKKIVKRFIIISILVYIITGIVIYVYFFPASAYERLFYIIPLLVIPILLLFIKNILTWYFNRKIKRNQSKLTTLKDEKKKILDEVMDKETYKVAKTILEKFAPEQISNKRNITSSELTPLKPSLPQGSFQQQSVLRYRGTPVSALPAGRFGASATPFGAVPSLQAQKRLLPPGTPTNTLSETQMMPSSTSRAMVARTPLPLPRDILSRDRSVLDKMVDYLVGDGPSNRFALICKNCSSHNGMALKEEFEYLSFRCCYCMTFNPARKQRPAAPKLESAAAIQAKSSSGSDSDDSGSECESEGPIITDPRGDTRDPTKDLSPERKSDEEIELIGGSTDEDVKMEVDTSSGAVDSKTSTETQNIISDETISKD